MIENAPSNEAKFELVPLRVRNLRGFADATLRLDDSVIFLVGPNNSGKTSLSRLLNVLFKTDLAAEFKDLSASFWLSCCQLETLGTRSTVRSCFSEPTVSEGSGSDVRVDVDCRMIGLVLTTHHAPTQGYIGQRFVLTQPTVLSKFPAPAVATLAGMTAMTAITFPASVATIEAFTPLTRVRAVGAIHYELLTRFAPLTVSPPGAVSQVQIQASARSPDVFRTVAP